METRLAQIASFAQKDKAPAYVAVLNELFASPDQSNLPNNIHTIAETVLQESTGLVVGRQVIAELVKIITSGAIKDTESKKQIIQDTITLLQPRIVSYEEPVRYFHLIQHFLVFIISYTQSNNLRFQLADILESEEDWSGAARVLMGLSLDAGQRYVSYFLFNIGINVRYISSPIN